MIRRLFIAAMIISAISIHACKSPQEGQDQATQCAMEVDGMKLALAAASLAAKAMWGTADPTVNTLLSQADAVLSEARVRCSHGDVNGFEAALEAFTEALANLALLYMDTGAFVASADAGSGVFSDYHEAVAFLEGRSVESGTK